jgi:hypothetical protein
MALSPSSVQQFQIVPGDGKIIIMVDYQSMHGTFSSHEVFDPPLSKTLEQRSHDSLRGDAEITLDSHPDSYRGCHLVSRHTVSADSGDKYRIEQRIYQANNKSRAVTFTISGEVGATPVQESLVVHFQ